MKPDRYLRLLILTGYTMLILGFICGLVARFGN